VPCKPESFFIPDGETLHTFEVLAMMITAFVIYFKRDNIVVDDK
jgi:hypothetical protein